MNKIIYPLELEMHGPYVGDLQAALQLLMDRGLILKDDEDTRKELSEALKKEQFQKMFGKITSKLVIIFQKEQHLEVSGDVDESTANAINAFLLKLGVLELKSQKTLVVSGQVIREDGLPFKGGIVQAFHEMEKSVIRLGEDVTDAKGRYTIRYELLQGVDSINLRVSVMDEKGEQLHSSEVIRNAKPLEVIDLTLPMVHKPPTQRRIEGQIMLQHGLPPEQLKLRLYRLDFGGKATLLGETSTIASGQYAFTYDPGGKEVSLEVRAVKGANEEMPLSKPLNDLSGESRAVLNLVAPTSLQPLAAEYQRLSADITSHVGQMTKLAEAKENAERQDITMLNRVTGWDARLIALASSAAKLSADPEVGLSQDVLYAMSRAGLPSDKMQLAQVSEETVDQALTKVRDAGIVDLGDQQVAEVQKQFETFSRKTRLAVPAPGSRSTYGELLEATGLEEDARTKFASVYLKHRGDAKQLWKKAAKAGVASEDIQTLQLQGKLAFLTKNSEVMTIRLQKDMGIGDPVELVGQGFYQSEKWEAEVKLSALAGNEQLDALIPPAYEGKKVGDRLKAYAGDMARKVRLSYPTQVIGHMVEHDDANEFKLGTARSATTTLLKNAAARGFRLGQTPVEAFVRDHPEVLNGIATNAVETAKQGMKTLQRGYQLTPSNEAMTTLLSLGLTSAYDIVIRSQEDFITSYGFMFSSLEQARLVYRKAQQVTSVTYNLFTIAKKLDSEAPVYGMSAPVEVRESVKNELIKQFPTMESLFGSMDFCECEHCRSVLSPAAYLVDLLQFIDAEPHLWDNFLADWKDKHDGQDYTDKYKKPYDALIERRPDLPYISLTCENTNTALPYIDVVNEIMEYYVANDKLDDRAAHDTGDATTSELLAEPQNVIAEAYTKVQQARYPINLPFDLWIETVRRFCEYFETPLWQLLEAFRQGDELFVPAQSYDREAIFIESLGLSPSEYAIFTDPDPLAKWYELYGYDKAAEATTEATNAETGQRIDLNSAKALSRRLGLTYKELVEIVQTGFVNPKLAEMTLLYKLGVAIQDVLFYRDHKELLKVEDSNTLSPEDQKRLEEVKAFEVRLDDLSVTFQASGFDAKVWLNNALDNNSFDDILVLVDIDASCNFDQTTLRYSFRQLENQRAADAIAFLKINLFVRLWRKLGWTIEETDRALQSFVPENTPFDTDHLTQSPLRSALIYLAHLKALDEQVSVGKQSLMKLITLWSDLATTGKKPLYAQLFLRRSVLKSGEVFDNVTETFMSVFDDPLGQYLSNTGLAAMAERIKYKVSLENIKSSAKIDPAAFSDWPKVSIDYDNLREVQSLTYLGVLTDEDKAQLVALSPSPALAPLLDAIQIKGNEFVLIKGHVLALQGALGLTADEIGRILTDAGKSIDTAELSLANVSLLYRYGLLAKALKLSVRELITLKDLSGLDPVKLLHPDPLTKLEDNYPFTQTLRFVEIAGYVKESGLKIEDLDYLLRHHIEDTVGKYRPNNEATLVLMKTLAEGIRTIHAEHAVPEDAGSMDEEVLRQKLGLALPPDVVERFLAMMNTTVEFTATRTGVQPEDSLKPEQFAGEPSIRQLSYNDTREEQKLTFRGVLFDKEKNELERRLPKPVPPNPFVPSDIFSDLLDDVQEQALSFYAKNLQKQAPDVQPEAGFLDAADFDLLFGPTPAELNEAQQQARVREQRTKLVQAFLPFLQQRLIRQFIIQTLTAHTGADPTLVESLLTDYRLLGETQPAGTPQPLLAAFTAIGERGLTATFFASSDGSGASLATSLFSDADTGLKDKDGNPLKPDGTNSARFEGYLEVPAPGVYRFYIVLDRQNAEAELRFDHLPDPLFLSGIAANNEAEISQYLELKPGIPYRFSLTLRELNDSEARLLVQGEILPKNSLAQLTLYPLTAIERGEHALILLNKVLQFTQSLNLNEREVRYLLTHADDFDNLNLSKLPTRESDDSPAGARALFTQFLRLAGYARLKHDLAGGTDDLIGVFEANEVNDMDKVYQQFAKLTRRDEAIVKATDNALSATPAFANELAVQRLWEALQVIERFGVSVASVVGWTWIVSTAATPEQCFAIARDLKDAIKARFEPETWQRVAQPIFDKLRQRQRDALVAFVMHQHGFARMEQLYEYFLIDPGMEPVVQTSRIRLAIASVQLFIQRCLLNLERQVHPSVINARQWEWMKRYRIWEANRKIFLFPENWLEPEFRDDKTHLFTELEGNLLQGDVSSDLVEDAFLNYLKKLDELARLDIVAMHLEYKADPALNTLHVIGRTYNEPKYFYRRYAHQVWTPWEPITAEIEGDHLAPVVWRDRLYLFWVTFMDKPDENAQPGDKTANEKLYKVKLSDMMDDIKVAGTKKQVEMQLHWSEYLQGKWSNRASSEFVPVGTTSCIGTSGGVFTCITEPLTVSLLKFDNKSVFIHVSKEPYENGEERGVYIHLGGVSNQAFYLAGRNSNPELDICWESKPLMPYSKSGVHANRYSGSGALTVEFKQRIAEQGKPPVDKTETPEILREGLREGGAYTLLPCDNNIILGSPEIASLVKPLFYQDNAHTLFIEPTVTENPIEEWPGWVTGPVQAEQEWDNEINVIAEMLQKERPPDWPSPESIIEINPEPDWLRNPGTVLHFDGALIGPRGRPDVDVLSPDEAVDAIAQGGQLVNVHAGSSIAQGTIVVAAERDALDNAGLVVAAGGLNVVGSGGFNSGLEQNYKTISRSELGAGNLGGPLIRR
ncbi:MAG: hypothetical protein KAS66_09645 [Candidatus Omnitrophica bacterium]|nr:hypothetical protein [Candidatus Omnitrophota bacterium]